MGLWQLCPGRLEVSSESDTELWVALRESGQHQQQSELRTTFRICVGAWIQSAEAFEDHPARRLWCLLRSRRRESNADREPPEWN